jgi:benzoate/toluate 1,2-dioxygenase alpha subunit
MIETKSPARHLVVDHPAEHVFRVHRDAYTDPRVFDAEMDAFYKRGWVYVAHESQLPAANDFLTCRIAGQSVILTRGEDGKIRGLLNRCRHRGATVCRMEQGNAKRFTCMYHQWTYENTGELRAVTGADGFPPTFDMKQLGLVPVPRVDACRGFIFASLAAQGPSLAEHLGNAAAFLDVLLASAKGPVNVVPGANSYEYKGNWKLQTENALDYYHLPFVHSSFRTIRESRGEPATRMTLRGLANELMVYVGQGHGTVITKDPVTGHSHQHLYIFPNLVLLEIPAPQIRVIEPVAFNQTRVRGYFYTCGEPDAERELKLRHYERFYGPTGFGTPDDIGVFQACTEGYAIDAAPWNDLSRGIHRESSELELPGKPRYEKVGNITDDTFMRGFYRHWLAALS